jgi:hypothetical protein
LLWPWLLGLSYVRLTWSASATSEARRRYAAEALRWLERQDARHPADTSAAAEYFHSVRLGPMAQMAFEIGDLERAEALASATLRIPEVAAHVTYTPEMRNWRADPDHIAVHDGHIVLGKVALARGDLDEASRRLLLAGKASSRSDGTMATIGPDRWLAQDLLNRGRTDAVVDYLLACRDAWTLGRSNVDTWIGEIRAGETARLEVRGRPSFRSTIDVFKRMRRPS